MAAPAEGKRARVWLLAALVALAVVCAIGAAAWACVRWRARPPPASGVSEQAYSGLLPPGVPPEWAHDPLVHVSEALLGAVNVSGYFRLGDVGFTLDHGKPEPVALRRLLARLSTGARVHPDDAAALAHAYVRHEQGRASSQPLSQVERISLGEGDRACVIGDVHGQFSAVPLVLERCGIISGAPRHIVFNGDLVDRGDNSVGVMVAVLAAHAVHPAHVHLGRGNHEDAAVCRSYGLMAEVAATYGLAHARRVYASLLAVFAYMPSIHVVAGRTAVLHGGLPTLSRVPLLLSGDMPRPTKTLSVPANSALAEVLWNDPDDAGRHSSRLDAEITGRRRFTKNDTDAFLRANGLQLLVRSHEAVRDGLAVAHDGRVVTVFSAPGYGGGYVQDASFLTVGAAGTYEREVIRRADCAVPFV